MNERTNVRQRKFPRGCFVSASISTPQTTTNNSFVLFGHILYFCPNKNKTKNLLHIVAQTLSAASREEEVGERERDKRKEEWHTPERSLA